MTEPAPELRSPWLSGIALVAVLGGLSLALILPDLRGKPGCHDMCLMTMGQLGLSFHNYHSEHGSFPPAYTANPAGHRLHSWRTLLLPVCELRTNEDEWPDFDLKLPWHHPRNRPFAFRPQLAYQRPYLRDDDSPVTHFVVVTGPGYLFDGVKATRREEITDNPAQTILVVECLTYPIYWSEPRDLTLDELYAAIQDGPIDEKHQRFRYLTADGGRHYWRLEDDLPSRELLHAMLTIAGGEDVEQLMRRQQ